eukprot:CAMPEP_0198281358 /NCGR_PEP_ID=MMETSP1449-20131203/1336_1 /TAXON_ID=420275 /ORGANISM="Attheya septentrionalis, Strain CCMP2084" /LENGTH=664 /DNA_ID=CAMNT_0043977123 /DNA_START=30 /DNA_END=2020 /DNA_ORIENTATION=+
MSNSTTPVVDLPAAPFLDALPDTASPDYPMALARRSARLTMKSIFDKIPFPWQENIIAHLNMMRMPRRGIPPAAVLLIQPTGGGKSMVRDTFAAAHGGIHWSISPLLSLTADQKTKLNKVAIQDDGAVVAINLDFYRTSKQRSIVIKKILDLPPNTSTTIMIFSSPQALTKVKMFHEFFKKITDFKTSMGPKLQSFTVDELHLFTKFGMHFRSEFLALKPLVFNRLKETATKTYCPILIMTATCTKSVVNQFEQMTGLTFSKPNNIFWPNPIGMQRRTTAAIRLHVTTHIQKVLNAQIRRVSGIYKSIRNYRKQFIVFGNSRVRLEQFHLETKDYLNDGDFHGDLVLITGPMLKEQKFFYTDLFLNTAAPDNNENIGKRKYDCIGCFATRSLGSAGWDGADVHLVFSVDFPTDILSVRQEIGRCGRRFRDLSCTPTIKGDMDAYHMVFSLRSIIYLIRRMYLPITDTSNKAKDIVLVDQILSLSDHRAQLWNDIIDMMRVFIIPQECLHAALERRLANPYCTEIVEIEPCHNLCDYCDGRYKNNGFFPKIVTQNLKKALIEIFCGPNNLLLPTLDDALVTALRNYPNASRLIFGSKSAFRPPQINVQKVILLLLASEIITYRIHFDPLDEDQKKPLILARLNATFNGDLLVNCDDAWSKIPSKP